MENKPALLSRTGAHLSVMDYRRSSFAMICNSANSAVRGELMFLLRCFFLVEKVSPRRERDNGGEMF